MPLKIHLKDSLGVEKAIFLWIELLAAERYQQAFDLTLHDPYYQWTASSLENVINGYGLPYNDAEQKFKVTDPSIASYEHNLTPYKNIMFFDKPFDKTRISHDMTRIGYAEFSLPLNNEWSDLTASFSILTSSEYLMLELNDIHVL